jgi:glycine betaine/choline ABC-type transport system substrate-binding protein
MGRVTGRDMRAMNRAVDLDRRGPGEVAREFLARLDK